jgi:hypothetical protein
VIEISAIIPTRDRRGVLLTALEGLAASTVLGRFEVVVSMTARATGRATR